MITIRPYIDADREIVRKICCDVADRGNPIENIFPDREFAAELLTSYYTDFEPQSSFVGESNGQVVGYVNGCLDNRHYGLVLMFLVIPKCMIKGISRGTFLKEEFWKILKGGLKNWRRVVVWRKQAFHSHQGHLHIGVAKEFWRHKVGEQLIQAFLKYAKEQKTDEMTASVHDGNVGACKFFERSGFVAKDRYPMIMAQGDTFQEYHSITYAKNLE